MPEWGGLVADNAFFRINPRLALPANSDEAPRIRIAERPCGVRSLVKNMLLSKTKMEYLFKT
jgi:hypothetical protein